MPAYREEDMKKIINFFKRIFSNRKRLAIFVVPLVIAGLIGLRLLGSRTQQPQYQTEKVERGTIVATVTASGQILTSNLIEVKTQASGQVSKVYVGDGDSVSNNQKIVEITLDRQAQQKNASAWSSYLSAKNSVDLANATAYSLRSTKDTTWKKFYDLAVGSAYQNSDGIPRDDQRNSSSEFQSLQADWLAAEAKYKNQQAVIEQSQAALNSAWLSYQLSSAVITAPIAGTVGDLTISPGMVIAGTASDTGTTSQKIAVIRSEGAPVASFNISEVDVSKVKKGQVATITLDSFPGKTFTGKVIGVDRTGVVSQGVTNYPAIIQFDTDVLEILPNMAASVSIITDSKTSALIIPSSALQTQDGQSFVRTLSNGQPQQVFVETGLTSDNQVEVTSGLSEGDEVITGTVIRQGAGQQGISPFGVSPFGGGALRPGGFGGGSRGAGMQR